MPFITNDELATARRMALALKPKHPDENAARLRAILVEIERTAINAKTAPRNRQARQIRAIRRMIAEARKLGPKWAVSIGLNVMSVALTEAGTEYHAAAHYAAEKAREILNNRIPQE
jgi:hypothetical protein